MRIEVIRVIDHKIKELRFIFNPLNLMHDFDQKCNVVNCHFPPINILDHFDPNHTGEIALAFILAAWVRRPHALARCWDFIKKAEFAVEEDFRETWSFGCGSVVVSEAEGIRVTIPCGR